MKRILAIALIGLIALTAHAWTPLLLDSPAVRAFVLSDSFGPAVFGALLVLGALCAAVGAAIVFHPASLAGRTEPEGGE